MKAFFERYSYEIVRMLLNQFVSAVFGFSLATASQTAGNDTLMLVTSIGAVLFYLALTYGTAWRIGSRDKITIDLEKRPFRPATGLLISLLANAVNLLLAVVGAIGLLADIPAMESLGHFAAMWVQCMYQGILVVSGLGEHFWIYFLLPLPALLVSFVAYVLGVKDFHITKLGVEDLPASDRPTKKEMQERKKQNRK